MTKRIFLICLVCMCCMPAAALSKPPLNLGGFTLGTDIHLYKDRLEIENCQEIKYQEYLGEGILKPTAGFKSGSVAYGLCDKPDHIVRIKLKYSDSSKKFFRTLLDKFESRLGKPDEYQGDPFQTFIAWKWSFDGKNDQRISLILQHNIQDSSEKLGNAVKMTLISQIEKEKACYESKYPQENTVPSEPLPPPDDMWNLYIPY